MNNIEKIFKKLAKQWEEETINLSSPQEKIIHPAYQQIIGLGPDAIPLILKELERELGFWFWALMTLTREDPITKDMYGDISAIRKAWLDWGREKGYLEKERENIKMYSDGACSGNPGKGAYATILIDGDTETTTIRAFKHTTNNRMELMGVIVPLENMASETIHIYSDSQYVVKAINEGWLENWIKKGWKKSNNKPVLNIDLWKRMINVLERHDLTFTWVKGHNSNVENNRCDELAVNAYNNSLNFEIDKEYIDGK